PTTGKYLVEVHLVAGASIPFAPRATGDNEASVTINNVVWSFKTGATPSNSAIKMDQDTVCSTLPPKEVELTAPSTLVELRVSGAPLALDYLGIKKNTQ